MRIVEWLIEQTKTFDWHFLKKGDIIDQAKEMEKQQNKIILTDEKIEKAAKEYDIQSTRYGAKYIFIDACKWYRDQLKNKQ